MNSPLRTLLALAATAALAGCMNDRVYLLSEKTYQPTPKDRPIPLYVNDVVQPHDRIALVQSFSSVEDTPEIRKRMLLDLRERAREVGADAVTNVVLLRNKARGYVRDEAVPFRAYTQGSFRPILLRGTAVRYHIAPEPEIVAVVDGTTATLPMVESTPNPGALPVVDTRDTEDPTMPPPRPATP